MNDIALRSAETPPRVAPLALALAPERSTRLRALLLAGCAAALVLAAWAGEPQARSVADPDLARLLRGMALLKGLMGLGALGLLWWRFGRPLEPRFAVAYLAGAWLVAGASMLVWQLTAISGAAVVFHLGEFILLIAAWRDGLGPRRRPAA